MPWLKEMLGYQSILGLQDLEEAAAGLETIESLHFITHAVSDGRGVASQAQNRL
jgi:hypothetical protein